MGIFSELSEGSGTDHEGFQRGSRWLCLRHDRLYDFDKSFCIGFRGPNSYQMRRSHPQLPVNAFRTPNTPCYRFETPG